MKLLVIGQSLEDHISFKGKESTIPGGIIYSILGLKSIAGKSDEIFLCTSVDKNHASLFNFAYKSVDRSYFELVSEIPKVYLNITDTREREERYLKINDSLSVNVSEFNCFDGILINMITGFDITIDRLKEIKKLYKGLIYFDVHTLSRGLEINGKREFRIIPDMEKWAENIDILQVNEVEFSMLFGNKNKDETIRKLFKCGIKILLITKGKLGARVYHKMKGEVISEFISSVKIETKNRVGCGDVFGVVFFYNYIKYLDISKALKLANIAGGCTASYDKIQNFERLRTDVYERLD